MISNVLPTKSGSVQNDAGTFQDDVKRHQQQGVEWCINREVSPPPMARKRRYTGRRDGARKTAQQAGLMLSHFKRRPLLLRSPAYIRAVAVSGADARPRSGSLPRAKTSMPAPATGRRPIVISTYGMLRHGIAPLKYQLNRIIYDEAHHLRNSHKEIQLVTKLKSEIMWFVIGTPIQKSLKVTSIVCFA